MSERDNTLMRIESRIIDYRLGDAGYADVIDAIEREVESAKPQQGEGWRYFRDGGLLYRDGLCGDGYDAWHGYRRKWRHVRGAPIRDWGAIGYEQLTESEAVERFGPEILDGEREDETPHAKALRELDLKPGDRVRVERKVPSYDGGWTNNWIEDMDDAVGRVGIVKELGNGDNGVWAECADDVNMFPAHVLTVVSRYGEEPPTPPPAESRPLGCIEADNYRLQRECDRLTARLSRCQDDLSRAVNDKNVQAIVAKTWRERAEHLEYLKTLVTHSACPAARADALRAAADATPYDSLARRQLLGLADHYERAAGAKQ